MFVLFQRFQQGIRSLTCGLLYISRPSIYGFIYGSYYDYLLIGLSGAKSSGAKIIQGRKQGANSRSEEGALQPQISLFSAKDYNDVRKTTPKPHNPNNPIPHAVMGVIEGRSDILEHIPKLKVTRTVPWRLYLLKLKLL